jgi:hypothetical protein
VRNRSAFIHYHFRNIELCHHINASFLNRHWGISCITQRPVSPTRHLKRYNQLTFEFGSRFLLLFLTNLSLIMCILWRKKLGVSHLVTRIFYSGRLAASVMEESRKRCEKQQAHSFTIIFECCHHINASFLNRHWGISCITQRPVSPTRHLKRYNHLTIKNLMRETCPLPFSRWRQQENERLMKANEGRWFTAAKEGIQNILLLADVNT